MAGGKPLITMILRKGAAACYIIAALTIFLINQKGVEKFQHFIAEYSDWNGFTYFGIVNVIGCGYNLAVTFIPSGSALWKTFVALDVVFNILLGTSLAVGWQTYSLITWGNIKFYWAPTCGLVPKFCRGVLGSLIVSSLGVLCSFLLLMLTLQVSVDPLLITAN